MSAPRPSASPLSCRLPDGFSEPQTFADVVDLFGVAVRRAGVATSGPGGVEVTGSAAAFDEDPVERARFELFERVATVQAVMARAPSRHGAFAESDAPERYRYARSNGVALHATEEPARARARQELAERDRVLRAWYGESIPVPFARAQLAGSIRRVVDLFVDGGQYDVELYSFPDDGRCAASRGLAVVGAFGFARRSGLPLAMGFGARPDATDAAEAAVREALQSVAFLWDEPVGEEPTTAGPTALQQLEYWQAPSRADRLRQWLSGGHARYAGALSRCGLSLSGPEAPVVFHDLTPEWSAGLHVARATCAAAVPLVFGEAPWASGLPDELRVQPLG